MTVLKPTLLLVKTCYKNEFWHWIHIYKMKRQNMIKLQIKSNEEWYDICTLFIWERWYKLMIWIQFLPLIHRNHSKRWFEHHIKKLSIPKSIHQVNHLEWSWILATTAYIQDLNWCRTNFIFSNIYKKVLKFQSSFFAISHMLQAN